MKIKTNSLWRHNRIINYGANIGMPLIVKVVRTRETEVVLEYTLDGYGNKKGYQYVCSKKLFLKVFLIMLDYNQIWEKVIGEAKI